MSEPKGSWQSGYKAGYAKNLFDREDLTIKLSASRQEIEGLREQFAFAVKQRVVADESRQQQIYRAESADRQVLELSAKCAMLLDTLQEVNIVLSEMGWHTDRGLKMRVKESLSNNFARTQAILDLLEAIRIYNLYK